MFAVDCAVVAQDYAHYTDAYTATTAAAYAANAAAAAYVDATTAAAANAAAAAAYVDATTAYSAAAYSAATATTAAATEQARQLEALLYLSERVGE